jgi:aminopeptidase YwaD
MATNEAIGPLKRHVSNTVGERNPFTAPARYHEVQEYIEAEMGSLKAGVLRRHAFNWSSAEGVNFILEIPGKLEGAAGLIGAHYDSVAGSPGADDNSSGVAVLLELGRRLAAEPPLHSVWLVAFDLEEWGMGGSKKLAQELKRNHQRPNWMVSIEMVGYRRREAGTQHFPFPIRFFYPNRGDFILLVGNNRARKMISGIEKSFQEANVKAEHLFVACNGWLIPPSRFSDQAAFWDTGVAGAMLTDTSWYRNQNYHSAADTIDTLDFEFMADILAGMSAFAHKA